MTTDRIELEFRVEEHSNIYSISMCLIQMREREKKNLKSSLIVCYAFETELV